MRSRRGAPPRDIGRFVLKLRPKPKTRKALEQGDRVIAKVKVSINPLLAGTPGDQSFPSLKVRRRLRP